MANKKNGGDHPSSKTPVATVSPHQSGPSSTVDNGRSSRSEAEVGLGASEAYPDKYYIEGDWKVRGDYRIVGPTIMVIDGDFDIGNHTIYIAANGSLTLYVGGDIKVSGNGGLNNLGTPKNLQAYGMHSEIEADETPAHTWTLSGNGALTGVVYAPNAKYVTNGGGSGGHSSGSVVAHSVVFNGSPGPFHYDVTLSELILPFGNYSLDYYELLPAGYDSASTAAQEVVLFFKVFILVSRGSCIGGDSFSIAGNQRRDLAKKGKAGCLRDFCNL